MKLFCESNWISFDDYLTLLDGQNFLGISVYHRSDWLLATSSAFNCEVRCVKTSVEGNIHSITPFLYKKKGPFKLVGSSLRGTYTEFAGPLFIQDLSDKEMCEVIKSQHQLISKDCDYLEWRVESMAYGNHTWGKILEDLGYQFEKIPSLLIDLSQGEEKLWTSFTGRARTAIRKAEKAKLTAKIVQPDQNWIESYYEILTQTFARQGLAVPHPLSFYRKIETLSKSGFMFCVESRIEESIDAAAIIVHDKSRMMYLSGVSTKEGMRFSAPSLVQWCAMQKGISDSVLDYDMGGLGLHSIDKFKRSFGGTDISHSKWIQRSKLFGLIEPLAVFLSKKGKISLS